MAVMSVHIMQTPICCLLSEKAETIIVPFVFHLCDDMGLDTQKHFVVMIIIPYAHLLNPSRIIDNIHKYCHDL